MKRTLYALIMLSATISSLHADKIITDPTLGYSIYLPTDSWIRVVKTADHHRFYDTTFTFGSQISIVRHSYVSADYPTPENWTRANFIAYKLCVDYSFDPWAAMLYYDTASTVRQGVSWATESYATFFALDTALGAWSEYTRFTARAGYAWELYAIGDTSDMMENIGTYAGIIQLITLPGDTNAKVILRPQPVSSSIGMTGSMLTRQNRYFDPLGRKYTPISGRDFHPAGAFIRPDLRRATIVVK
jgi:hypothetical protein